MNPFHSERGERLIAKHDQKLGLLAGFKIGLSLGTGDITEPERQTFRFDDPQARLEGVERAGRVE